ITKRGVWSLCPDPDEPENIFWIGSNKGLLKYNRKRNEKILFSDSLSPAGNLPGIQSFYADHHGILWMGNEAGLYKMNRETHEIQHYSHEPGNENSMNPGIVRVLSGDSSGLWIGTDEGLTRFYPESGDFIHFRNDPLNKNSLSDNRIYSIHKDKIGTLWIGTNGGGLNKLVLNNSEKISQETQIFRHYTTVDGLPDNVIYGILEDEEQNLWLSTNVGLSRFSTSDETFINFDLKYGLQHDEFDRNSYYK
ncbi:MAG: hypothetical protein GY863_24870, partial [bacterium]|nr:hypothetical protein [bacterium]